MGIAHHRMTFKWDCFRLQALLLAPTDAQRQDFEVKKFANCTPESKKARPFREITKMFLAIKTAQLL
jgi:hypothetical protein